MSLLVAVSGYLVLCLATATLLALSPASRGAIGGLRHRPWLFPVLPLLAVGSALGLPSRSHSSEWLPFRPKRRKKRVYGYFSYGYETRSRGRTPKSKSRRRSRERSRRRA